jgi:hypothetical protein
MAGMGPPPKAADQRARRNATVSMTQLPASGRSGRAPAWPLASDSKLDVDIALTKLAVKGMVDELEWLSTARERSAMRRKIDRAKKHLAEAEAMKKAASVEERKIWTALWKTPQATQWEKRGWFREVALYARHQAKAEAGSLDDSKEARQREDRLGLNDMAMLRLRWEIIDQAASKPAVEAEQREVRRAQGRRLVSGSACGRSSSR